MDSSAPALSYATSAIVLRRMEYGDHDCILTLLTPEHGKISVLAKNARKSVRRFSGTLELLYLLNVVVRPGHTLSFIDEASVEQPFLDIRSNIRKMAVASYWVEVLVQWLEDNIPQPKVYTLLSFVLMKLDQGHLFPMELTIIFQMRFLDIMGFLPELRRCSTCDTELDLAISSRMLFDVGRGWLFCEKCADNKKLTSDVWMSRGTLKKLLWVCQEEMEKSVRIRFKETAYYEAVNFLETFLPHHLEKDLKSLKFLRKMRNKKNGIT